jgi:hypothetical protein
MRRWPRTSVCGLHDQGAENFCSGNTATFLVSQMAALVCAFLLLLTDQILGWNDISLISWPHSEGGKVKLTLFSGVFQDQVYRTGTFDPDPYIVFSIGDGKVKSSTKEGNSVTWNEVFFFNGDYAATVRRLFGAVHHLSRIRSAFGLMITIIFPKTDWLLFVMVLSVYFHRFCPAPLAQDPRDPKNGLHHQILPTDSCTLLSSHQV